MLGRFAVPAAESMLAQNNGGGPTTVNITAGDYYPDEFAAHLQTVLNAQRPGSGGATWTVALSTITGIITISMSASTYSITFGSTNLQDILGYAGNISGVASLA